MRSAVVFLGVAVGESVPRFDIVMALIGGSLTGPLVFILPPLIYIRARGLIEKNVGQISTPEVFSSSQRQSSYETSSDPRIHSQSVYHGFLDENTDPHRYSYAYFEDDEDDAELTDLEDEFKNEGFSKQDLKLRKQKVDDQPVLLEANKIIQRRRKVMFVAEPRGFKRYCNPQRLTDWFGYSVVILGVLITLSSTYININNTIKFVRFTPPCIVNATAAFIAYNISET